ncbi:MAG: ATP-binding cassette domain-containing protein [Myxococcota bacterium]
MSSIARRTLLEWFAQSVAVEVPNSRIAAALSGGREEEWTDWLRRAADVLGWHADEVSASPEAIEGEQDAWWVSRAKTDREQWLVVAGARGEGTQASVIDGSTVQEVEVEAGDLSDALSLNEVGEEVRWIRLTPALPLERLRSPKGGPKLSPFRRLARWTRLERGAVLAVVAYSAVIGAISLALPLAVQSLVNLLAFGRVLQPLLVISAGLLLVLSVAAALRVLEVYIVELLQRRVFTDLSRDVARRLPAATPDAGGRWGLTELINRFFDVVGIQKSASYLLLSATEVIMSTVAGLLLLGFYHPYLLVFDLVLISALGFVTFRLGASGIETAVEESHAKYELAAWLESVARRQHRFLTPEGSGWSARETDRLSVDWLMRRSRHFSVVLRQTIGFAGIQAFSSASLLGLGSFLVWNGQLTLGQLVASELIITGVMAQLAKFGKHVESFYDLTASVEKVGMLVDLETEPNSGELPPTTDHGVELEVEAVGTHHEPIAFRAAPGECVGLYGLPHSDQATLFDVLYGRRPLKEGRVLFDQLSLSSLAPRALRHQVELVGRGLPVGATLEENLTSQDPGASVDELRDLLRRVGLQSLLGDLEAGLQTWIYPDGEPLSRSQLIRLEVARAIRSRPRLLLVDGGLDRAEEETIDGLWEVIAGPDAPWTLLVGTDRRHILQRCPRRFRWVSDAGLVEESEALA